MNSTPCPLCGNFDHGRERCPALVYADTSYRPASVATIMTAEEILRFVDAMSDADFFKFVSRSTSTPTKLC